MRALYVVLDRRKQVKAQRGGTICHKDIKVPTMRYGERNNELIYVDWGS